ncbi:cyclin-domain-containing protein, partial [Thamnocephalis sphaerospora]
LASCLAHILDRLVAYNDRIPLDPSRLTRFHSRAAPAISINDYLARIVRYTSLETACLLSILLYIDRVCAAHPTFTIASLTVHRFIIAAVTVSAKAICDTYCTNAHYAKVGGVSCTELNALELELLRMVEWRLFCQKDTLQRYYVNLVQQHPDYRLAAPPA